MSNRGIISTLNIAERLKAAQKEIDNPIEHKANSSLQPILFVNGRLNRKNYPYVAKNFAILKGIEDEIKHICRGLDLVILNYLLFRGIESIKKEKDLLSIDYPEIEKLYNSIKDKVGGNLP